MMGTSIDIPGLKQTVQDAIAEGRVGTPSFMRCIAQTDDPSDVVELVEELTALGETWFGSKAQTSHSPGAADGVYRTVVLKWPKGQGAVVTVSADPTNGQSNLNLMLIGSRGTLYHEG